MSVSFREMDLLNLPSGPGEEYLNMYNRGIEEVPEKVIMNNIKAEIEQLVSRG